MNIHSQHRSSGVDSDCNRNGISAVHQHDDIVPPCTLCLLLQGPDWNELAEQQKRTASARCSSMSDTASADAAASNYLWTPHAADCAMNSDDRPQSTRSAPNRSSCLCILKYVHVFVNCVCQRRTCCQYCASMSAEACQHMLSPSGHLHPPTVVPDCMPFTMCMPFCSHFIASQIACTANPHPQVMHSSYGVPKTWQRLQCILPSPG